MTAILRIEHPVPNFDRWRTAFESDPVGRERGGVRHYRVMRPYDERERALIDLEFDDLAAAEAFLAQLRELWSNVDVMRDPQARIVELVDSRSVAAPAGA